MKIVIENLHVHQCNCNAAAPKQRSKPGSNAAAPQATTYGQSPKQGAKSPGRPRTGVNSAASASSRVTRDRGPATLQECVHCHKPASVWSLDKTATNTAIGSDGRAYSQDSNDYLPKCRPCSRRKRLVVLSGDQEAEQALQKRSAELAELWNERLSNV